MAELTGQEQRRLRYLLRTEAADVGLKIPECFKRMREVLSMDQARFAGCFGLSEKEYIEIEEGRANPSLETLARLGRPFGFEVAFVHKDRLRKEKE